MQALAELAEGGLQVARINWERQNRTEDLAYRDVERRRYVLEDTRRKGSSSHF